MSKVLGTIVALARRLLRAVFGSASWDRWIILLTATFGLPLSDAELVVFEQLTGRASAPATVGLRIREAWFIIGRRSGKSMIAALIAVYLTCCREYALAPGERGVFMIIAADRRQARVVKRYISGLLHAASVLTELIADETKDAIELTNGIIIEINTASFRSIRGYTVIGAVCDEIAFWPTDDSADPDTEILAALRPAMSTVADALLVCITSPYARRGETWKAFKTHFGKSDSRVLVARAATEVMNPLIDASLIAEAYQEDPARAAAEYGAEFRRDIQALVSREVVEAVVVAGRRELLPGDSPVAWFVDCAGGSGTDSMTLAGAHAEDRGGELVVVLDVLREVRPPFSPEQAVAELVATMKPYGATQVYGDRYAGQWPREQFQKHGIVYEPSVMVKLGKGGTGDERTYLTKSDLYRELLPLLNSRRVELLDDPRLIAQLLGLERRVARSGKDSIDHGPQGHDDVINAAAGALVLAAGTVAMAGHGFLQFACELVTAAKVDGDGTRRAHADCIAQAGHISIDVSGRCKACGEQVSEPQDDDASTDDNPWLD